MDDLGPGAQFVEVMSEVLVVATTAAALTAADAGGAVIRGHLWRARRALRAVRATLDRELRQWTAATRAA